MDVRSLDGRAGDVDHGSIGSGYPSYRRPDHRIAQAIADALGGARTVLNVGAGSGFYESAAAAVTAVEPSQSMRSQRAANLPGAVNAVAERLPFGDGRFDGAMTLFSVPQWSDLEAGLREMRLDPAARQACSAWSFIDDGVRERFTTRLRDDLDSGAWDERFGHLRCQAFHEGSLVILRATPQDKEEHHHGRT
ncbi:class I SAM-dependent methyltransferase [Streptomyces sp. NPDC093589]|uniref:class I SAM-dependent methyltransferase n=1 Tax=Streptomyces sp. NPDC093589 TaxID=3366043 RepID=UPI003800D842